MIHVDIYVIPTVSNDVYNVYVDTRNDGPVVVNIVNPNGQNIELLDQGYKQRGRHEYLVNMSDQPNGIYYIRAIVDDSVSTTKLIKQ